MSTLKLCKVCSYTRDTTHGLAVSSLEDLKIKGGQALKFNPDISVSVVLEDDGTVVEDENYFLCLPPNTKFMLLCCTERWAPKTKVDGGTAWLRQESQQEGDTVDSEVSGAEAWCGLATRLSQDLASVLLLSEAELQSLVDVPCAHLEKALGFQARALQDALQGELDRREEARQAKELLQLYLKSTEHKGDQAPVQEGETVTDAAETREGNSTSPFSPRTLMVLKGKTSPETRLSNEELQVVVNVGIESVAAALGWSREKSAALVAACEEQLHSRLERVQAARSLSSCSQLLVGEGVEAKRKK